MRRAWVAAMAGVVLSGWCARAWAAIIQVPTAAHRTIQSAIDAAVPGDEVVIQPGIYNESIHLNGKDIILRSVDPSDMGVVAATTIFGGYRPISVVTLSGTESEACVLDGLTITGGGRIPVLEFGSRPAYPIYNGGGIYAASSRVTIRRCHVVANSARRGGGIFALHAGIEACLIVGNYAQYGGGVYTTFGRVGGSVISYNTIYLLGPSLSNGFISRGGGIYGHDIVIENCLIANNRAVFDAYGFLIPDSIPPQGQYIYLFGGGVYLAGGSMNRCLVEDNRILYRGTRVENYNGYVGGPNVAGALNVENCIFQGSSVLGEGGLVVGSLFIDCPEVVLQNNTVRNSVFAQVGTIAPTMDTQFSYNLVHGPISPEMAAMPGVITGDPRFVDAENGDFRLAMDSPAIDAGIALEGFDTDIEGAPRPVKSITWEERGDGSGT